MAKTIKETVVTENLTTKPTVIEVTETPVEADATTLQSVKYLIYFFFGALDILLAFRFILKLLGASLSSDFVTFIYDLSGIFIAPFEGMFRSAVAQGVETTAVFEPATLIAVIVYGIIAWGIVKLIVLLSGKQDVE